MPEPSPNRAAADRNLLFGVLALQMNFLSRDALIAAMDAWVRDRARPLGRILIDQGVLLPAECETLENLVELHLQKHGGDAERSLAAVPVPEALRAELECLTQSDQRPTVIQASV